MKTATNIIPKGQMFILYYRAHTANTGSMWAMEGKTVHLIHIDGEAKATRRGNWNEIFYGFIEMPNGMVRTISATFVVQTTRAFYTNFQTVDMPKDEAREFYAMQRKRATWRGSVSVEKNHQFI